MSRDTILRRKYIDNHFNPLTPKQKRQINARLRELQQLLDSWGYHRKQKKPMRKFDQVMDDMHDDLAQQLTGTIQAVLDETFPDGAPSTLTAQIVDAILDIVHTLVTVDEPEPPKLESEKARRRQRTKIVAGVRVKY
jgi:hypothetical protein